MTTWLNLENSTKESKIVWQARSVSFFEGHGLLFHYFDSGFFQNLTRKIRKGTGHVLFLFSPRPVISYLMHRFTDVLQILDIQF